MENQKFHEKDDCGILEEGQKIPYFGIKLTKEQVQACKGRKPTIYSIDGIEVFKIKKEDGSIADEEMVYVMFV